MLEFILMFTLAMVALTGLFTIVAGMESWRLLRLKFVGVIISTISASGFLLIHGTNNSLTAGCQFALFNDYIWWSVLRNFALIIFNLDIRREVIKFHGRDRRVANVK